MIRTLTLAAATAALLAGSASAQSVRITTVGKSPAQLHSDIAVAAKQVCRIAIQGATFPREMYASCYKAAVASAVAQAGDPALAAVAGIKLASR